MFKKERKILFLVFLSFSLFFFLANLISAEYSDCSIYGTCQTTGSSSFIGLTDTPSTYSGSANYCLIVNPGETGVIFTSCPGSGGGITWAEVTNTTMMSQATFNTNYTANNDKWLNTTNTTYNSYNLTGLIKDWNSTGLIVNWNGTNLIIDWNATGLIANWSQVIGTDFVTIAELIGYDYYNATNPPPWNATNTSYYLLSNPYGYYNVTNPPPSTTGNIFDQVLNTTSNVTFVNTTQTTINVTSKGIFGDSSTDTRATRALNLIATNAVMRVWRISTGGDPAVELIASKPSDPDNITGFWDFFVANTGNNEFIIRDRVNSSGLNLQRLIIDSAGNITIPNNLTVQQINITNDACINGGNCLSKDWNSTGLIVNWNGTNLIIDWNATGLIANWSQVIGTDFVTIAELIGYDYYNATNPPPWNATNTSYYLVSNPYSYYNETDFNISDYLNSTYTLGNITEANTSLYNWVVAQGYITDGVTLSTLLSFSYWNTTFYGGIGNWSLEKGNYSTYLNDTQTFYMLSNPYSYWNITYFGGIGNWSADKSNYSTYANITGEFLKISQWNATNETYVVRTGDEVTGNYTFNNSLIKINRSSLPSGYTPLINLTSTTGFSGGAMGIDWYNQNENEIMSRISVEPGTSYDAPLFKIITSNGGTTLTTRLLINQLGRVGINTETPMNTLNVLGDGNFTDTLYSQKKNLSLGYDYALNSTNTFAGANYSDFLTIKEYSLNDSKWSLNNSLYNTTWSLWARDKSNYSTYANQTTSFRNMTNGTFTSSVNITSGNLTIDAGKIMCLSQNCNSYFKTNITQTIWMLNETGGSFILSNGSGIYIMGGTS